MKKQYRVSYYYKSNPEKIHSGNWHDDRDLIQAWVDHGNREYPNIHHFVDEGEKPQ
jgi:hypothetical protein